MDPCRNPVSVFIVKTQVLKVNDSLLFHVDSPLLYPGHLKALTASANLMAGICMPGKGILWGGDESKCVLIYNLKPVKSYFKEKSRGKKEKVN